MDFLENLKNKIDLFIRNKTKFSRKNYYEKPESNVTSKLKAEEILFKKYNLNGFNKSLTKKSYVENLYLLDVLDKYFPKNFKENASVLDIGSKNWTYVLGQFYFFNKYYKNFSLEGIELDAYRLNSQFYSRAEIAKYFIKNLKNTTYLPENLLNYNKKCDIILWFLPFLFKSTHMKWGLEEKSFYPEKLLVHAYNLLNDEGKIFIINQGSEEFLQQEKLCENLGLKYQHIGEIQSEFSQFKQKRFAGLIKK